MKAVVCQDTELRIEDVPDPVPGPGQVLLNVIRCGICGSDLHARHHADAVADATARVGVIGMMRTQQAVVMGHEFSGAITSYGPRTARQWSEGTPVVALPMLRSDGQVQLTGLSEQAPGGYAEKVLVQESMTFPVTNGLDPSLAALTEPMAVAWHAVRKSRVGRGETAVVIGCGPIGLATILMLKARGVRTVIASDFSAVRRELAQRCGADVVIDPAAESPWTSFAEAGSGYWTNGQDLLGFAFDTMDTLRKVPLLPWAKVMRAAEAGGRTPRGPVVFECVGVPGMIDSIIDSAPIYSRVVVVGVCMEPDRISPVMGINKEMSLQFVFAYDPGEFHDTLQMIATGKVDPSPLVTGTVPLGGVAQAFDDLASADRHAKILIDPAAR